jgi:histidinol phosphatase-like enzyme
MWSESVVPTLQRLHGEGYSLLILSNQKGIGKSVEGKKATTVRRLQSLFHVSSLFHR